jgi:hypothetical protein
MGAPQQRAPNFAEVSITHTVGIKGAVCVAWGPFVPRECHIGLRCGVAGSFKEAPN